ncbi:23S rRNA (cytidine-2'-O)-methyltransferase TlyA [Hippea jasoniae]|uniref:23S rRNA (cytidine-2'-O)-methyltransferase TlyA n=1 Tax=Hippea jasoniae TaxID=944479 RepID=UPI0005593210|nr:TlyA family RNA methyltransferase [Hippea jasoniae]
MRLDLYLVKKGLVASRSRAEQLIKLGSVLVNGSTILKPSYKVKDKDDIQVIDSIKYVSRAGLKLEHALDAFGIEVKDKICLDVGASTGGFTDCLLKKGAYVVFAVDVGKDQLDESLKGNPRIKSFENTDIRNFSTDMVFDIITVDVSFISLTKILEHVKGFLAENGDMICLIKPQFEVGAGKTKKGIVKDQNLIEGVLNNIKSFVQTIGLKSRGIVESPILGKDGNREFLIWLKHG